MASPFRLQIQGLPKINRLLKRLPPALARKGIRRAMRKALAPIRDEVKATVPVKTGRLKRAVKIRSGRARRGSIAMRVVIGKDSFGTAPFYGSFRDLGTVKIQASDVMRTVYRSRARAAQKTAERLIVEELEAEARNGA